VCEYIGSSEVTHARDTIKFRFTVSIDNFRYAHAYNHVHLHTHAHVLGACCSTDEAADEW